MKKKIYILLSCPAGCSETWIMKFLPSSVKLPNVVKSERYVAKNSLLVSQSTSSWLVYHVECSRFNNLFNRVGMSKKNTRLRKKYARSKTSLCRRMQKSWNCRCECSNGVNGSCAGLTSSFWSNWQKVPRSFACSGVLCGFRCFRIRQVSW